MDFGIARAIADPASTMTQTGATLGTAQYLSPEQAQGGAIDPRSDIYSTGCMLYELLTGKPPFTGDSPVSVAYQHVRENPVPPSQIDPDVPPAVDAIVMKSLAKNAGQPLPDRERDARGHRARARRSPRRRDAGHGRDPRDHDGRRPPTSRPPTAATAAVAPASSCSASPSLALIGGGLVGAAEPRRQAARRSPCPTSTGKTVAQAQQALEAKKLTLGSRRKVASDKPADTIIDQDPLAAGLGRGGHGRSTSSSRSARRRRRCRRSSGLPLERRARPARRARSSSLGKRTSEVLGPAGEHRPRASTPGEGTEVDEGSSVDLVALQRQGRRCPTSSGEVEAQAEADLTQRGLQVTVIAQVTSSGRRRAPCIAQSPNGGTTRQTRTRSSPSPSRSRRRRRPRRRRPRRRRPPSVTAATPQRRRGLSVGQPDATTGASPADRATAPGSPHTASQFASIRWPPSVSTDSGWNCTPSTASSRWRSAMITPLVGAAGDLELVGHGVRLDRERVVARRGERVGQAGEHARAVVVHQRGLAVQQLGRAVDGRAVRDGDRLVAEAHAEQRHPARAARAPGRRRRRPPRACPGRG